MAIEFENFEINHAVIKQCIKNGLLTDWFLFNPQSLRIAPPLIINEEEILKGATIIQKSIEEVCSVNK
jgi:4-aminobutyrate aminotransferase-like enzyme